MLSCLKMIAVLMAVKLLLLVMVPAAMADSKELDLGGQSITGHKIVSKDTNIRGRFGYAVELFPAKPVGGKLLIGLSKDILEMDGPKIGNAFWHGDYDDGDFYWKYGGMVYQHAARIYWLGKYPNDSKSFSSIISFYRPHNADESTRLTREEVDTQLASLLYVSQTWNVPKFNLAGHAGGGTIAMEAARRLPRDMVARVVLASPRLVVGGDKEDPFKHLKKMPKDIPIFVVYDTHDQIVYYRSEILPYISAAMKYGAFIKSVEVNTNDHPYHHTQWRLGNHLRKPENSDFRPQRRF